MRILALASLLALGASCGESAPSAEAPKADKTGTKPTNGIAADCPDESSPQTPSQGVRIAAAPELDLVGNEHLWHVYRDGLLLPLAAEGMRKYNHEYSRPWKGNRSLDGETGRVLQSRQSVLHFGWFDKAPASAVLRIRAHGLVSGQRVSISLNGKLVANANLDAAWQTIEVPVKPGLLRKGENALKLHVAKAGSGKAYGLWNSIEVRDASVSAVATMPGAPLSPASDDGTELRGFSRMLHLVEVPKGGWLRFATRGQGTFAARIVDEAGNEHSIFSQEGDAPEHELSLDAFAGSLVRLELTTPEGGAWLRPRISLEESEVQDKPKPVKNVILLVVDALRSDHVPLYTSVYGEGAAVAMPNTQAEAEKGSVVFLHNQAASPSSPPSHGSIQTGMIPRVHGVDGDRGALKAGTPMISTQAEAAGIASGYYGNNPFGMGRLEEPGGWTAFHQPGKEGKSNDCTTLVDMMLDFSKEQSGKGKRVFISSLPYETHTPYRFHEGISKKYYDGPWRPPVGQNVGGELLSSIAAGSTKLDAKQWSQLKALYKGEAEYWDQCFGQLTSGLAEAGLLQDTALVLTSDHGEGMFEHGRMGHAFGHYRELGDVPFVVFWPALGPGVREIDTVTSHRDIAPTILDMLGAEIDRRVQGESVLPLALRQGSWTERVVSLEYGRSYSLRSKRYKLIVDYGGKQEFYDLGTDPWEAADQLGSGSDALRYLRDMAGFFLEYRSQWRYREWGTLNRHGEGFRKAARAREKSS